MSRRTSLSLSAGPHFLSHIRLLGHIRRTLPLRNTPTADPNASTATSPSALIVFIVLSLTRDSAR